MLSRLRTTAITITLAATAGAVAAGAAGSALLHGSPDAAQAATPPAASQPASPSNQSCRHRDANAARSAQCLTGVLGDLVNETAKATGMSADQVLAALRSGKTVDDIAGGQAASIKAAVIADYTAQLQTRLDKVMQTAIPAKRLDATGSLSCVSGGSKQDPGLGVLASLVPIVVKDTGQTASQVVDALRSGKTLNDIAGPKAQQVESDAINRLRERLDAAVKAGKITEQQEQQRLDKAKTRLDQVMAQSFAGQIPSAGTLAACAHTVLGDLIRETAKATGQTDDQVFAALQSGKTFDQIAGGQAAAVKAAVIADQQQELSTRLDKLMSTSLAGRLKG